MPIPANIDHSWQRALQPEFDSDYMAALFAFLKAEKKAGKEIYPPSGNWFRALELTPLSAVRVVILGQDPYHGPGQAHGLCFSVQPTIRTPPSLLNIYRELESDLGLPRPDHGFLQHWADQGVLMLNSVLSVEAEKPASHQKRGWECFTDAVIRTINARPDPAVFLLWGAQAQKKTAFVDASRHLLLTAAHPSPLAAHRGFFGCRHFSQCNAFLVENNRTAIDWSLPDISHQYGLPT